MPAWQPSRLGKSRGTPPVGEASEGRRNRCGAPPLFTAVSPILSGDAPRPYCSDLPFLTALTFPLSAGEGEPLCSGWWRLPLPTCQPTAVTSLPALPASGPALQPEAPPS